MVPAGGLDMMKICLEVSIVWDPLSHSLVRRVEVNGDPTTLYKDLMGPLCELCAHACCDLLEVTRRLITEISWKRFDDPSNCRKSTERRIEMYSVSHSRVPTLSKK